jgi:hypothetical protein
MDNLTVEQAHTFFVSEGQWLVHNSGCDEMIGCASFTTKKPSGIFLMQMQRAVSTDLALVDQVSVSAK